MGGLLASSLLSVGDILAIEGGLMLMAQKVWLTVSRNWSS